jgi:hypothetical protein
MAEPKLQEAIKLASDADGCPGEGHGVPIPHGADITARASAVLATLSGSEANINAVIGSLPGH